MAVPLFPGDNYRPDNTVADMEIEWFARAVSLSRKGVVAKLKSAGIPDSWKKSPLLRNCFPLILDADGHWSADITVRLDEDLGIVYGTKEH